MTRTILIDADVLYYQFAFRNQVDIDWDGDGELSTLSWEDKALVDTHEFIEDLKALLKADKVCLAESSRDNYRKYLWPDYKAHRKDSRKPEAFRAIKDWVTWGDHGYLVVSYPWLEGDDILGIWATTAPKGEESIIVSIDKDMETVPGKLYLWNKPDLGVREISEEQAYWNHMYQTLVGDSADGYKGCPGIGPVKATRILNETELALWDAVVDTYESKGLTEEDALLQARLAFILRHGYFRPDGIRLWHPTESIWITQGELDAAQEPG